MNKDNIIKKIGKEPGKKIAIFAGVHGNERVGILALERLIKDIEIERGEVWFVYANPRAVSKNVRYIEKNLNRCFLKELEGSSYEELRAKELMGLLDKCDALLDLHASNNKNSTPFIICEKEFYDIAKIFDFNIISFGWNKIEPGATDGYMQNQGKLGICLECGSVYRSEENQDLAYKSVLQFLKYFGAISSDIEFSKNKKKIIKVFKAIKKKTENFKFNKDFADFEELEEGKVFAQDGDVEYIAKSNECIILPNSNKRIGEEVFVLGKIN